MTPTDHAADLARLLRRESDRERPQGDELRAFIAAADEHGVIPLLWQAASAAPGTLDWIRQALDEVVRAAVTRELFVRADLRRVGQVLAAAGVSALFVKGSALAYTVYPDPWVRPRTDTDLLVSPASVAAASAAIESCGYRRSDALSTGTLVSHQIAFERSDDHGVRHVLDLHWKIANPQLLADVLPFEDLWTSRTPLTALGASAWAPSPVASIVLACVHRLGHHQGQDRLIWLYDLKLLTAALTDAGWGELVTLASARGVAGLCLDGLRETKTRLGGELPAAVESSLSSAAPAEPSAIYLAGRVRRRDVLVSDLKTLGSWPERMRLLREHAFPPVAFIQQRYGTSARWLLPALYAHRLVTGAFRWTRT